MDLPLDKPVVARAERHPEKAHRPDNPVARIWELVKPYFPGYTEVELPEMLEDEVLRRELGIPQSAVAQGRAVFKALYKCFDATDASLAEINPLILTGDGRVVALDAKLNFDSNALFRHPDIVEMRDLDEEDPAEVQASKFDLSYISLDGDIGCARGIRYAV